MYEFVGPRLGDAHGVNPVAATVPLIMPFVLASYFSILMRFECILRDQIQLVLVGLLLVLLSAAAAAAAAAAGCSLLLAQSLNAQAYSKRLLQAPRGMRSSVYSSYTAEPL
jgi:hypothetical protein